MTQTYRIPSPRLRAVAPHQQRLQELLTAQYQAAVSGTTFDPTLATELTTLQATLATAYALPNTIHCAFFDYCGIVIDISADDYLVLMVTEWSDATAGVRGEYTYEPTEVYICSTCILKPKAHRTSQEVTF